MAAFTVIRDLPTTDTAASWFYPIILYDGTKAIAFSWYSTGGQVHITHFDDVVPESGNYNANVGSVKAGFSFPDYFGWFRITNDGGTLTYSISPEGVLFFPVYSEAASYLSTITKVGFGLDHYENAVDHSPTNDMASILWSWVES